jgi:hypothetical protein
MRGAFDIKGRRACPHEGFGQGLTETHQTGATINVFFTNVRSS